MKKLRGYIQYFVYLCLRSVFVVLRIFPIKNNKIVVNAFVGKGFCDNPKYIAKELIKYNVDIDLVWIVNDLHEPMPKEIRVVKRHSLAEFYELSTARIWVDNARIPLYAIKRKGQYYIETWHGCIGLKRVGRASNRSDFIRAQRVKHDTRLTDLMISNSDFSDRLYKNDFLYGGEILKCGSPRMDMLINISDAEAKKIKCKLGVNSNKHIVLYAPTFRDNGRTDVYDVDFASVISALETRFGGDWVVLIKLHPVMTARQDLFTYSDSVINCSDYRDIYELMAVSEALITDYSSVQLEMGLIYKPVFLYTKDIDEFAHDRGLYFAMESLPFSFATNNEELANNILSFSDGHYHHEMDTFNDQYLRAVERGTASKAVADYIMNRMKEHG